MKTMLIDRVDPYKAEKEKTTIELLNTAEENLAYNLVWLSDQFDLQIRQGNKEVIERLDMLNEAWRAVLFAATKIEKGA